MPRVLTLLGALLLTVSACGKDLGELCEEDADCKSDRCVRPPGFGAEEIAQCTLSCDDGCPGGSTCVSELWCLPSCDDSSSCPEGTVCDAFFGACFAACNDDSECVNNTCSAAMLCDGT